jgi:hypothetical protein
MPMRALGTGGAMGAPTEGGMGDFVVEMVGTITSSRTAGLGMSTASIPILMGG